MPREDYEAIRRGFTELARARLWEGLLPSVQRGMDICNFVCRLTGESAAQSALVVSRLRQKSPVGVGEAFEYTALFVNRWAKDGQTWKMAEMRMDIMDWAGDHDAFSLPFQWEGTQWRPGATLPQICGELDSPWAMAPLAQDVLSEEEKILEAFSRYAFGIDTLTFGLLPGVLAPDLTVRMAPWGIMTLHSFLSTLKYQRQSVRHWAHPVLPEKVEVCGDTASVILHRVAGHRRADTPPPSGQAEDACARYQLVFRKEQGSWQMRDCDYRFGAFQMNA